MKKKIILNIFLLLLFSVSSFAFDHEHTIFSNLLKKNVHMLRGNRESKVDYSSFKKNHSELKKYLNLLSEVSQNEFSNWNSKKRLAFLINAYNGFTIELIVKKYPVKSIKDTGSFFKSPWKINFIKLFGKKISLDDIEHGIIRKKGQYDEPRIHFALVCASIGCPPLQNRAFTENLLEKMLEDSLINFLSDNTRNRYDPKEKSFYISKIFNWYGGDFNNRYGSIEQLLKKYFKYLVQSDKKVLYPDESPEIKYLDYDWNLNDYK